MMLVRWGLDVCLQSPIYEEHHLQQLRLVQEEMGLSAEPDPE